MAHNLHGIMAQKHGDNTLRAMLLMRKNEKIESERLQSQRNIFNHNELQNSLIFSVFASRSKVDGFQAKDENDDCQENSLLS